MPQTQLPSLASLPDHSRRRLARCIGMLGSDHDGEVVAAARAAGRELARHGFGLTDLAVTIERGASNDSRPPPRSYGARDAQTELVTELAASLEHVLGTVFNEWEQQFIRSVWAQVQRHRRLSEKQLAVVERLVTKLRGNRSG